MMTLLEFKLYGTNNGTNKTCIIEPKRSEAKNNNAL